jgi:hypothetical protein
MIHFQCLINLEEGFQLSIYLKGGVDDKGFSYPDQSDLYQEGGNDHG